MKLAINSQTLIQSLTDYDEYQPCDIIIMARKTGGGRKEEQGHECTGIDFSEEHTISGDRVLFLVITKNFGQARGEN